MCLVRPRKWQHYACHHISHKGALATANLATIDVLAFQNAATRQVVGKTQPDPVDGTRKSLKGFRHRPSFAAFPDFADVPDFADFAPLAPFRSPLEGVPRAFDGCGLAEARGGTAQLARGNCPVRPDQLCQPPRNANS